MNQEQRDRDQIRIAERVIAFMEPYAREYPNITVGEAFRLEGEALEREAAAQQTAKPDWRTDNINLELYTHKDTGNKGPIVTASILGKLAVHPQWLHRKYEFSTSCYVLAHLPTRRVITRGLGERRTKELTEKLSHLDWNFDQPDGSPRETRQKAWVIINNFRFSRTRAGR